MGSDWIDRRIAPRSPVDSPLLVKRVWLASRLQLRPRFQRGAVGTPPLAALQRCQRRTRATQLFHRRPFADVWSPLGESARRQAATGTACAWHWTKVMPPGGWRLRTEEGLLPTWNPTTTLAQCRRRRSAVARRMQRLPRPADWRAWDARVSWSGSRAVCRLNPLLRFPRRRSAEAGRHL